MIADEDAVKKMRQQYKFGGFGYGDAKQALFETLLEKFASARLQFDKLMGLEQMDKILQQGAMKAKSVANETLFRVRKSLGFY